MDTFDCYGCGGNGFNQGADDAESQLCHVCHGKGWVTEYKPTNPSKESERDQRIQLQKALRAAQQGFDEARRKLGYFRK